MLLDAVDFVKQSNEGKLDSRLKTATVTHPIYHLERTFCVVCGKAKGWVSQASAKYIAAMQIVVVCDDCEVFFGNLPLEKANIPEITTWKPKEK